jgi:hypothetical protein
VADETQPDAPQGTETGVGTDSGEGTAAPGGDAALTTPAASSRVGDREPGDTDDIGSTEGMTSATGGLAGTSR